MELVAELCGWSGALTVLAGYAAFSLGWTSDDRVLHGCSLAGSAALLVNGYYHGAMPSVVVNVAWGSISAFALMRAIRARRSASGFRNDGPDGDGDDKSGAKGWAGAEASLSKD